MNKGDYPQKKQKIELYNDNFQNYKKYGIPKAQLVIADIPLLLKYGQKHGFMHGYPIFFIKPYSAQVLKANMKIVGATECAVVLYRDKLPKFRNDGQMIFDWFEYKRDTKDIPKIHPTQKPVRLLKELIRIFTDEGDVVIDPCAGSGTTLRACKEIGRSAYGFEIDKTFYTRAVNEMLADTDDMQLSLFV